MNEQHDLFGGHEQGRQGMAAVAAKAEEISPGWSASAFACLCRFAEDHDHFTGEQIKTWSYANGLARPHKDAAWGAVIAKASRRRIIHFVGYEVATAASRHGAPNRRWKSLVRP